MAIVKASFLRRSQGTATPKAITRAATYYTVRDGPDRAARQWQTSDGRTTSYEAIADELRAHARSHAYSYRVVVSTKETALGPQEYHQALREWFATYYFIAHGNTAFPHAHVIGFRHQRLSRAELQTLYTHVAALEQARQREGARQHDGEAARTAPAAPAAPRQHRPTDELTRDHD